MFTILNMRERFYRVTLEPQGQLGNGASPIRSLPVSSRFSLLLTAQTWYRK